jgi:hypothetical protein
LAPSSLLPAVVSAMTWTTGSVVLVNGTLPFLFVGPGVDAGWEGELEEVVVEGGEQIVLILLKRRVRINQLNDTTDHLL